ncbi:MAG: HAMP domain-containing sensor histidine kinase [Verrucomicrobiae bacterium]|nr:HAMP domain-containing sensor histidine kinase [Verrucomicrobiae bacterium]
MIFNSIKWRLLLWMAFLLILILTGLGIAICHIHLADQLSQFDDRLEGQVATLTAALSGPVTPDPDEHPPGETPGDVSAEQTNRPSPPVDQPDAGPLRLPPAFDGLFGTRNTNSFYFVLWAHGDPAPFRESANAPDGVTRPHVSNKDTGTHIRVRHRFREAYHVTEHGDCVLVGRIVDSEYEEARHFALLIFFSGAGVLGLILAAAWWLLVRALRPLEKISAAALKIASGDLSQRINVPETESELGRLAAVLNSTFARLETAFAQQRQFTSDASHELRTPISVLISEAQTTLARERTPDDYREALAASLDAAQKMRRLTESLLELARLDAGQEMLRRENTNLAAIVQDSVKFVRALAVARRVQIHCDLAEAKIFCDASRIAQVVTNLLTNAINYNYDEGEIWITTHIEGGAAVLTVVDSGLGIAPSALPRVFERFFQADESRTAGNTGLGLSICKAIVEAHGGSIEVSSSLGRGSTFTVYLPA